MEAVDTFTADSDSATTLDTITAGVAGPATALKAAREARDASTNTDPGSGYSMPAARSQSVTAGEEWKTTWGITAASMDTWTTANATKGPAFLWWEVARTVTVAYEAWKTKWGTDSAELTVGSMTEAVVGNTSCDLASGTWTANTGATDKGACKTACETAARDALAEDVDTTAGSASATTTANNGGQSAPVSAAAATSWCGAYSFNNGASAGT